MNPIRKESLDDIIGITEEQARELGVKTANTLWGLVQVAEYKKAHNPILYFNCRCALLPPNLGEVVSSSAKDNMLLNCRYNDPQLDDFMRICAEAAVKRWNELLEDRNHDS